MFNDHVHQAPCRPKELVKDDLQQRPHVHLVEDGLQVDAEARERLLQGVGLFAEDLAVQFVERFEDEVDKGSVLLGIRLFAGELTGLGVEVDVSPQAVRERLDVKRA